MKSLSTPFFLLLITLSSFPLLAQRNVVDIRIDEMLDHAYHHKNENFDSSYTQIQAIYHGRFGELNPANTAKSQCYYGGLLLMLDSNEKSQEFLKKALNYYLLVEDLVQIGRIYNNLSVSYTNQLNYIQALEYQKKCIEIKSSQGMNVNSNYVNMGAILYELGQYQEAIAFFQLPEAAFTKEKDYYSLAKIATNISICYNEIDAPQLALKYGLQAIELEKHHHNQHLYTLCNTNLGSVYLKQKKWDNALHYYRIGLMESQETKNKFHELISLNNLGNIYLETNAITKAEEHLLAAYAIALTTEQLEEELVTLQSLTNLYQQLDSLTPALYYFEKYTHKVDSLNQLNIHKKLPELLEVNKEELDGLEVTQAFVAKRKSQASIITLFILLGLEVCAVLCYITTHHTKLVRSNLYRHLADIAMMHISLGSIFALTFYWLAPYTFHSYSFFVLIAVVSSTILSLITFMRKRNIYE